MDATDVFDAFHFRSERAQKWLETLPRRKVTKEDPSDSSPLVDDFRQLRKDLIKEGVFEPIWSIQILRLAEVLLLHFLSMWVVLNYSVVLGGLIYGLVVGRNGLLMHDMGHRAFFCNMYLDKIAHTVFFGLGITGSASFWNNQHNKHHAATQEMNHDTDLATLPVVAFHKEVAKQSKNKLYLQFQWLVFLPAQLLLFYLWKVTHLRHCIRTKNWAEFCSIMGHKAISLLICMRGGVGFSGWFIYEAIGYAWGGFYLASTFSMNHTHRPVAEQHAHRDWVHRSTEYTTNCTPSLFTRWFTGYLCLQMEHHLFPNISHPRLIEVAPRLKALLEKHGEVYDCRSMHDAFVEVMVNLYNVGNE
jgi:fatty acid desaturase